MNSQMKRMRALALPLEAFGVKVPEPWARPTEWYGRRRSELPWKWLATSLELVSHVTSGTTYRGRNLRCSRTVCADDGRPTTTAALRNMPFVTVDAN